MKVENLVEGLYQNSLENREQEKFSAAHIYSFAAYKLSESAGFNINYELRSKVNENYLFSRRNDITKLGASGEFSDKILVPVEKISNFGVDARAYNV